MSGLIFCSNVNHLCVTFVGMVRTWLGMINTYARCSYTCFDNCSNSCAVLLMQGVKILKFRSTEIGPGAQQFLDVAVR